MKCYFYQEQFSAYYDRELPPSAQAEMATHLSQCPDCQTAYEKFVTDLQLISAVILPQVPDKEKLDAGIISGLDKYFDATNVPKTETPDAGREKPWPMLRLIPTAAVLLIGVTLGITLYVLWLTGPQEIQAEKIGQISHYRGQVETSPDNKVWSPVSFPGNLVKNITLRSNQQARALFSIDQYTYIGLNEKTVLKLKNKRHLFLEQGEAWFSLSQSTAEPLRIDLKSGHLELSAGEMNIQTTSGITVVLVYSGQAVLTGPDGLNRIEIKPGTYGVLHHHDGHLAKVKLDNYLHSRQVLWVPDMLTNSYRNQTQLKNILWRTIPYLAHPKLSRLAEKDIRRLGATATGPLTGFLDQQLHKSQPALRRQVVRILSDIGDNSKLEAWVTLLKDKDPTIRYFTARGLKRITGETFGFTSDFWRLADRKQRAKVIQQWEYWLKQKE